MKSLAESSSEIFAKSYSESLVNGSAVAHALCLREYFDEAGHELSQKSAEREMLGIL